MTRPQFNHLIVDLDPVAWEIGGVKLHWYGFSYAIGLILVIALMKWTNRRQGVVPLAAGRFDDLFSYVILGIVCGGRIGYVLCYNWQWFLANPADILRVWQGGMSFHGGMLGAGGALFLFAKRHKIDGLRFADLAAVATPVGLFLGRLANFANSELYGRPTSVPWAVIFPRVDYLPRHPSQIYEALGEGLGLGVVMLLWAHRGDLLRNRGRATGAFLGLYGLIRCWCEVFRTPDAQLGYLLGGLTMGQLLSLPMVIAGGGLLLWSAKRVAMVDGYDLEVKERIKGDKKIINQS